jgi:hypothetical protein
MVYTTEIVFWVSNTKGRHNSRWIDILYPNKDRKINCMSDTLMPNAWEKIKNINIICVLNNYEKVAAPGLESRSYDRRDSWRWPRNTLYPLKLAVASLTGGDRSIGIVRLRTKNHGVFFFFFWYMSKVKSWLQNHTSQSTPYFRHVH